MKKNYILLLLIIIVGVFIMTSIGFIYQKVDNSKENKSYISKKVNNYEYKDIESGMNEIKDTIDDYYDKDLPLIEELSEIKNQVSDAVFAFHIVANVIGIYKGDGWQAIIEENTELLPYISHAMYEIGLYKIGDATKNIEQILEIIENV